MIRGWHDFGMGSTLNCKLLDLTGLSLTPIIIVDVQVRSVSDCVFVIGGAREEFELQIGNECNAVEIHGKY